MHQRSRAAPAVRRDCDEAPRRCDFGRMLEESATGPRSSEDVLSRDEGADGAAGHARAGRFDTEGDETGRSQVICAQTLRCHPLLTRGWQEGHWHRRHPREKIRCMSALGRVLASSVRYAEAGWHHSGSWRNDVPFVLNSSSTWPVANSATWSRSESSSRTSACAAAKEGDEGECTGSSRVGRHSH
jgi:hypothetical protein